MKKANELQKAEELYLAPYAMKSSASAGRLYREKKDDFRVAFQRDRDRIIHCKAFRRLQAKTQVFVSGSGDHYRDRLTHTIEVTQIARDIARTLALNEDLSEAIALAHDLGHPPFGHGGEAALDEVMKGFNLHFEHNEQSHRIISRLEKIYPNFDGLNLTKEVVDGLLKHSQSHYLACLSFKASPHLESQVADMSDEIAYINHDIDDGIRARILTSKQMEKFALWRKAKNRVLQKYGADFAPDRFKSRIISCMISMMIHDLCAATDNNIRNLKIKNIDDVRKYNGKIVAFSLEIRRELDSLHGFLMKNFYEDPQIERQINRGKTIVKNLFLYYFNKPEKLPLLFRQSIKNGETIEIVIKDYIAGMTDRYAEETWKKLR